MARHAPEVDATYTCAVTPTDLGWLWSTRHHDRPVLSGRVDGPTTGRKGLRGRHRAERRAIDAAAVDRTHRRYQAQVAAGLAAHTWHPEL